jgi:putative transposase
MVERPGVDLSVRRQCALLNLARSGVYRPKPVIGADDLALMRRIDELHLQLPFYGSRRMTFELNKEGRGVNRKRVQRLMRVMGIEALVPRPGTSKSAPGHKIYPYLLRGLAIAEPNHVWAADITYIPMARGFLYLVAIIDWASRAVLAWRLSNTIDRRFCVEALEEALERSASRRSSTPIKARSSPAPRSPTSWKSQASRFPWTGAAASWTTFSSNGYGARSSMKRCI